MRILSPADGTICAVAENDRRRWDEKHAAASAADDPGAAPQVLTAAAAFLPDRGRALDVACGRGAGSLALARHGLTVFAVDVSLVALTYLRRRAEGEGVARRVHTLVADLDAGLPPGLGPFGLILCVNFHAPHLWPAFEPLLAPGGVLLMETLTRENARLGLPGPSERWLVGPDEILGAAAGLEVLLHHEAVIGGRHRAQLVARRPQRRPARRPR